MRAGSAVGGAQQVGRQLTGQVERLSVVFFVVSGNNHIAGTQRYPCIMTGTHETQQWEPRLQLNNLGFGGPER